ncbi:MAG: 30S ribosomal protein S6 [Candidatus Dasytiphilus stammeri]
MRHYEIVLLIHPDHSESISSLIKDYSKSITDTNKGKIHRIEDWGRRQLAYPIKKIHKAHYILMNIEINQIDKKNLEDNIKYNTSIIRSMIIRLKKAITTPSPILKSIKNIDMITDQKNISNELEKKDKKIDTTFSIK